MLECEELDDVFLSTPCLHIKSLVLFILLSISHISPPLSLSPLANRGHHSLPELAFSVPVCLFLRFSKGKKVVFPKV